MTVYRGREGEPLIRRILLARSVAMNGEYSDTLKIHSDSAPRPTLPQIAAKAGFQRLEIKTDDMVTGSLAPLSFRWQGIDGSDIDTSINSFDQEVEGDVISIAHNGTSLPAWYGELAGSPTAHGHPLDRNWLTLAAALRDAELMNTVKPSGLLGGYPHSLLSAAWSTLLSDTSSEPMHDDSAIDQVTSEVEDVSASALSELADAIDTRGLKRPVLVLNSHSFYTNEAVQVALLLGERPVTAIGPEGEAEQVQILQDPNGDGRNYALFIARNVPLHGYAVWDLGATLVPPENDDELSASPTHLENNSIRIEFDHATGLILKIFDKDGERDLLGETFEVQRSGKRDLLLNSCANLFRISTPGEAESPVTQLDSAKVIESGPVRAAIRITRTLPGGRSAIRQTVRLSTRSTRIDFVTEIDWHESDRSLTVAFPMAINSNRASYGIPFGYVERPTRRNSVASPDITQMDYHDWVDISEGDYGVALLNNGRLGCDVSGNTLRLRVPTSSLSGHSSDCPYRFTYSLLSHGGDLREGEVVENSFTINSPPVCEAITGNRPGKLPLERSFFEVDSASVFIDTIKRAENEANAIIVRLYEAHNTRGLVLLTAALPVKSAWLCDLLENNLAEIPLDNGEALLPFHPFEIITVKYTL